MGVYGQYHVGVKDRAELPSPVPGDARQKLWVLPNDVEQAARAQLQIS
jgi:hypothetical protein